ncbi:MAG TPA: hypothetical protein VG944_00245 [Fimbriimonas sp.]|nr:hypothetical protein [Fimbriimonas sp.]
MTLALSRRASTSPQEETSVAGPKVEGMTGEQLLSADWIKILVGNPLFSKRSDASGFTDLERARLGIPRQTADTDNDGDIDSIDPWPNAPNRAAERSRADSCSRLRSAFPLRR